MKIGVMGAGAVGSFIGGALASLGLDVIFVGRERGKTDAETHGMTLESLDGPTVRIAPEQMTYVTSPELLESCQVVLCAVKSAQTADAASTLATILEPRALVVSLQNGIHNADTLRAHLPNQVVLGGIVGFNVVGQEEGVFRRATSGPLVIEWAADPRLAPLLKHLKEGHFEVASTKRIRAKQWSKLVMNLSNALSALSGASTRDLLFDPDYRRLVRAVMREALAVLKRARAPLSRLGPLPVTMFPSLLSLPDGLFRFAVERQLRIDPEARSSMWQDLSKRRLTEVDELNGEIVRLAESVGGMAPINSRLVELIHQAERAGEGSPNWSATKLADQLANSL